MHLKTRTKITYWIAHAYCLRCVNCVPIATGHRFCGRQNHSICMHYPIKRYFFPTFCFKSDGKRRKIINQITKNYNRVQLDARANYNCFTSFFNADGFKSLLCAHDLCVMRNFCCCMISAFWVFCYWNCYPHRFVSHKYKEKRTSHL